MVDLERMLDLATRRHRLKHKGFSFGRNTRR